MSFYLGDIWNRIIGGGTPPTGNKDGNLLQQTEALVVQLLESGTANALSASATGSLGQQVAAAAVANLFKGAKTNGTTGGFFTLPAGPSVGLSTTTGAADTYGSWTEVTSGAGSAFYVVGAVLGNGGGINYFNANLGTGAAASEASIGEIPAGASGAGTYAVALPIWTPVAASTRLAVRTASDNPGATTCYVKLICINQSNVIQAQ